MIVVGAGPGGCAAAVQCARLGLRPLLLDRRGRAGGLSENACLIENYPGPLEPASGKVFAERLREYLSRHGLVVTRGEVEELEPSGSGFVLRGDLGSIEARAVVVAVGTRALPLGVPGEEALVQRLVFYEVSELLARPGHRVAVVGGGEAALDSALSLAQSGREVELCIRGERPRARGRLLEEVLDERRIVLRPRAQVSALETAAGQLAISVRSEEVARRLLVDALLVAVGRRSNAPPLLRRLGLVQPELLEPHPGIFLVGDARLGTLGQVGMAIGDGLRAAFLVAERLAS